MSQPGEPQAGQPQPNALDASPGPQPPAGPSGLEQFHGQMAAHSAKLGEADQTLQKTRGELAKLASMGDAVTPEDVIKGAGALVAHGLSPIAMASLLADMPEGGVALQGWVQQHLQGLEQREQQLSQVQGQVRHQQTQAALHLLARDHVAQSAGAAMGAQAQPQPLPSNSLTPGAA